MTILLLQSLTNSGQIHDQAGLPVPDTIHFSPILDVNMFVRVCMFSQFFENQPNKICSYLSEKMSKGRFLKPEKLQNHSKKGKGKEKKKE